MGHLETIESAHSIAGVISLVGRAAHTIASVAGAQGESA